MAERLTLADLARVGIDETGTGASTDALHRLRLVQSGSRGGGRIGSVIDTITLEAFDRLENVVALRMRALRQRWRDEKDGGFDGESRLRCYSDDGKIPSPSIKKPISTACETCPDASWREVDGRRRQPCQEVVAAVIAVGTNRRTFRIDFRGSSTKAARAWSGWTKANGQSLLCVAVDIAVTTNNSKGGNTYFSFAVGNFRLVEEADVPAIMRLYRTFETFDFGASNGGREA